MQLDIDAVVGEVDDADIAGDYRLSARLAAVTRCVATNPSGSFPSVMNDAELEGFYRFCSNPRVKPSEVLASHLAKTRERCADVARVLIVHDSTDFSFRVDGARTGLGRHRTTKQTFLGHVSLAVSADGSRLPIGVVGLHTWVRGEKPDGTEVDRWLNQIQ